MHTAKRFVSWLVVITLSLQLVPIRVFAIEDGATVETPEVIVQEPAVESEQQSAASASPATDVEVSTSTPMTDAPAAEDVANTADSGVAVVVEPVEQPALEVTTIPEAAPEAANATRIPRADLLRKLGTSHLSKNNAKDQEPYVRDEVLVKFKEKLVDLTTDAGKAAARAFADAQRLDLDSTIVASNIVVLRTRDGETVPNAIARLRWLPEVLHAQPNFVYQSLSNDPRFDDLWALQPEVMDVATAWTKNEGDGTIVAVIDSGVAFNHPDLQANMWDGSACTGVDLNGTAINGGCTHGFDFEDNDPNPLPTSSSHGTHVAGTVAAVKDNDIGIVGVAPQAQVVALKFGLATDEAIAAINFATTNGADVINASWGSARTQGSTLTESDSALKEAIEQFPGVLIAAAGNGDVDDPKKGDIHGIEIDFYPCDFDVENIICVAATNEDDEIEEWSDYGAESVDVGAPGKNILSTTPYLFEETFDQLTPPTLGGAWIRESGATTWGTSTLSDGNNVLRARGATSSIDSNTIDLSDSDHPYLSFEYACTATNRVDGVDLYFWDGTAWGFVNSFTADDGGVSAGASTYDLGTLRISNFKFGMNWVDENADAVQSSCLFDNFTIIDGVATADSYSYSEGTSTAAPHVAGVAALVKGYNKNIAVSKLKEIVLDTGDPLDSLNEKTVSGKRVNAANALNVFAPRVGLATENVLTAGGSTPEGAVKFNFVVRDGILNGQEIVSGIPFTLKQFEYSTDGGADGTWRTPTNGDVSEAIQGFQTSGRTTITTPFSDPENEFSAIFFNPKHADLSGLMGVDQDDVHIRFIANDGAVDSPFAVSDAFAVDLLAPTAVLAGTPATLTAATGATVTVSGDDAVTYKYSLDGDAFSPVTPIVEPIVISGLTDGAHTLRVIATDDDDNVQVEADAMTFTWTVDTTPGTALLTSKPDARTNQTSATFVIGGEDVATYTYTLDGGEAQGPFAVAAPIAIVGLADGSHTIAVTGIDAPGNTQVQPTTYTWIIDTSPAVPTISGVPSDPTRTTTATLTIGGTEVVAYRFSLDGSAFGDETPVATPVTLTGLADGAHTVRVIGRDEVGNYQAEADAATVSWTVDTTAPTLAETTPVSTPTNDTTPGLTITVENGAAWEVLRGETVLASGTGTGAAQSVVLSELTDGIYTFTLAATDAVGNRATLTLESFVVDTASPAGISLRDVPASPTNAPTATVTVVAGADVVAYRFALDGGAFGAETPVATPITLTGLADGTHTLRVIGRDAAGNWMPESIAITAAWSVDTVPPTATLTNLPRAETPATVAKITVSGTDVVAYRFSLDGGAFGDEALLEIPIALRNLADGAHTIRVIGRDAAGNFQNEASAATFSWLVDRSLAVPPTASPAAGTLAAQQQIRFSAPLAENLHYAYENPDTLSCSNGSSMNTGGEIFVDRATTIHVVACYAGGVPSEVRSFTYTFVTSGGGGGGGGGGGAPSFIFSAPAPTRAVESAPSAVSAVPATVATPVALGGRVLGVREFASGVLLRVDERDIFLLEGTVLHKVPNPKALWRYRNRERMNVTRADTTGYTSGVSVLELHAATTSVNDTRTVASGMLLRVDGGDIFLVEGTTLRRVPNLEVLWRYRGRQRIEARSSVLDRLPIGAPLT